MKVAALGNSHLGSLKRGWDNIASDFPSIEVVFFGSRGDGLQFLRVEGHKLIPTAASTAEAIKFTSGGRTEIDLAEFDVVLVYGCSAMPYFMPRRFYSKQANQRTMDDLTAYFYFDLLHMARRAAGDKPIYLGHDPLLAMEPKPWGQTNEAYLEGLEAFNTKMLAPLGVRMVRQPLETVVNGSRTHIKYAKGSKRLAIGDLADDEPHPERDIFHMNDEFGALWLRAFFAQIEAPSSARATARAELETAGR